MDLISYWLIYAVLALANKSNAKSKGKGGKRFCQYFSFRYSALYIRFWFKGM